MVSDRIDTEVPSSERRSRRVAERMPLDPRRRRVAAHRSGLRLQDAVDVCRRLAWHGLASTMGYAASPGEPAAAAAGVHRRAFELLAADDLDCHVSVKLSALGFDARRFADVAAAAARSDRRLHVDGIAPGTAAPTRRPLEDAASDAGLGGTLPGPPHRSVDGVASGGRLGGTVTGRWRRRADDAARAVVLGLPVRVVNGQSPAGSDGNVDATEGFLRVVDRLRGHGVGVAVATHAAELRDESPPRLTAAGTRCEADLLYGLSLRAPALVARRLGVPVPVYVPYGEAGAPYGVVDLVRRPVAARWLAQYLLLGKDKPWRSIRRLRDQL